MLIDSLRPETRQVISAVIDYIDAVYPSFRGRYGERGLRAIALEVILCLMTVLERGPFFMRPIEGVSHAVEHND